MSPIPQIPADLVTPTEEILNGKLDFLCRVSVKILKPTYRSIKYTLRFDEHINQTSKITKRKNVNHI